MHAYSKLYLSDAMDNIGIMFDCAVNCLGCSAEEFLFRLAASGIGDRLSRGDIDLIAGKSGTELALLVFRITGSDIPHTEDITVSISSAEYWAGSMLTYYQWKSGYSFGELASLGLDFKIVRTMFNPMHEADISAFERAADMVMNSKKTKQSNWLKPARRRCGFTQEELAEISGVPIRLIRAYEQGTIDTGKAEYDTIIKLKRCLFLI